MQTFGEVTITVTRGPLVGRQINPRGELKIKRLGGKLTVNTNLNGSISREFEPGAVRFDVSIERLSPAMTRAEFLAEHDFIIEEVQLGRTHFVRNASFDGDLDESGKSGEVSGIAIVCAERDHDERAA